MRRHSRFTYYLLLQIPGWLLGVIVLGYVQHWVGLSQGSVVILLIAWIGKDFVLYPLVKTAYDLEVKTGTAQLIGETGTATTAIDPLGYVRIWVELWRAKLAANAQPIGKDARIRVHTVQRLTLFVSSDPKHHS
jgi:membrane-bound ClpP family serine protease